MKTLHLHVKKKYFDEIKSGAKLEDYRLVTAYWFKRLVGVMYDRVIIYCGYPAKTDESKRLVFPWTTYCHKYITHPEFGNREVYVYAIALCRGSHA